MSPKALLEPILENGIKNTNFFEGRLLSGRDLQDQQIANRTRHRQLGRAIGAGVIEGLEVAVKSDGSDGLSPILQVKKGLAISAKGDLLELPQDENISLTRTLEAIAGTGDLFFNCLEPPTASIPNGAGIYILVTSPVSGYRERAPKNGLGDDGIIKGCGSRYIVEGVQFRLVELNPANLDSITPDTRDNLLLGDLLSAGDPASISEPDRLSKLRNILAHLCFGTETLKNFVTDPFALKNGDSAYINYSALDDLHRLELLNDCDVPLALFYWTLDGIAFLDLWSVRRRPHELVPSTKWPTIASTRRLAESEAMFFQFQEQIEYLISNNVNPMLIKAQDYFLYLPPIGFLPTVELFYPRRLAIANFFDGKIYRDPIFIEGSRLRYLVASSFRFPPIGVSDPEMIWVYLVRENRQFKQDGDVSFAPMVVFANPHMQYFGEARFDISRWYYSNYSSINL